MRKLNIGIITVLLVFQTFLSPLSVLADEAENPLLTEPTSGENGNDSTDQDTVIVPDEEQEPGTDETAPENGEVIEGDNGEVDPSVPGKDPDSNTGDPDEIGEPGSEDGKEDDKESENGENLNPVLNLETPNDVELDMVVPETVIAKISVIAGAEDITTIDNYRPSKGDKVSLEIELDIGAGHNFGEGSTLTYSLPDIFSNITGSGPLGEVGTYNVQDGNVVVVFNESIRDEFNQGLEVIDAKFAIEAEYSSENTQLEYELQLPGQETITLNFKPKNGQPISKGNGIPENGGNSSTYIDWSVDVNTELSTLSGATFTDTLTGNHTYKENSLKVIELTVDAQGNITEGSDAGVAPNSSYSGETSFTINLPDGEKAYRITYQTVPGDTENGSETYHNEATLTNDGVPKSSGKKSATVKYGTPLSKTVSGDKNLLTWTIQYNHNRKTIENPELVDSWEGLHELVNGSIEVKDQENNVVSNSNYTVTNSESGKGFTLKFNNPVTEPYTITYQTKRSDLLVSDGSIKNTITRSDNNKSVPSNYPYKQTVIEKWNSGPNYQSKTIDWTIDVNESKYEMNNISIDDTFTTGNMSIVEGSFKVVKASDNSEISPEDYTFTNKGESKGFTLTFNDTLKERLYIKYTTYYEIKDAGANDRNYENKVIIRWTNDEKSYESTYTDSVNINTEQKANGYKTGVYNYQEKRFKWSVGVNYNLNTIAADKAKFIDELSEGQEVLLNTIVVKKLDLTAGGEGEVRETLVEGVDYTVVKNQDNKFTLTFTNEISDAYRIFYETKDKDDIFPVNGSDINIQVTNNAKFYADDVEKGSWTKTVTVHHTDKTIKKSGSHNSTSKVDWVIDINYGQSHLENVVVKDTPGLDGDGNPNQLILQDTFKVYEVSLSGQGDNLEPTPTKREITGEEAKALFNIVVNEDSTFEITFLQPVTKAYKITYSSVFLGAPNTDVTNIAILQYDGVETGIEENEVETFKYNFYGSGHTTKVQLQIEKFDFDDNSKLLNGAKFELWGAIKDNKPTVKLTEGVTEDGILLFPQKIAQGDYYLKETVAPIGYDLSPDYAKDFGKKITIEADNQSNKNYVHVEKVTNELKKCTVIFINKDEKGNTIKKESTYILKDETGEVIYPDLNSDENGQLEIPKLPEGKYTLEQKEAPEGYYPNTNPIEFTVDPENCLTEQEFKNIKIPACEQFTIVVKENGVNVPDGVQLILKGETPDTEKVEVTTDGEGKIIFDYNKGDGTLPHGKYKVYDKADNELGEITVSYEETPCEAEVTLTKSCPQFTLTVNQNGVAVGAGAKITLVHGDDETTKVTATTNADGKIVFERDDLPKTGTYKVYDKDNTYLGAIFVIYAPGQCEASVDFVSKACPVFTLTVQDVLGQGRANVTVTVKDLNGAEVAKGTTDENGILKVPYTVEPGIYKVFEGDKLLGTINVTDTCSATVKPIPSGGGGSTPPTNPGGENPKDPNDGDKPKDPNDGDKPEDPNDGDKPKDPNDGDKPKDPNDGETPEDPNDGDDPKDPNNGEEPKDPNNGEEPNSPNGDQPNDTTTEDPTDVLSDTDSMEEGTNGDDSDVLGEEDNATDSNGNKNNAEKLPQTDGESTSVFIFLGMFLVLASGWMLLRRKFTTI